MANKKTLEIEANFTLQDLLFLEEDPDLLNYICAETGVTIWSLLRTQVFRIIMSSKLYEGTPLINFNYKKKNLNILKSFLF